MQIKLLRDEISQILPKNDKKKKKSGGFQSMGLSYHVLQSVLRKGYKVPTPIQRKAIPVVMEGKNVVAMARTGSGKTAAFLIPLIEKLKSRVAGRGARALIFSPTRELAIQTYKFTRELARKNLKAILVLGGDKIENQFAAIHESPDIIIATPGRFLHVVMEMNLKLSSVEYVVFDEADRLFEMGFQEQLREVTNRLPSERQTLLFSATLPKVLVEFVKLGVEDPVLIRLDVDMQISENLKTAYFLCRSDDKTAILLHLLKNVINLGKELTVVFLPTKHHVDYLNVVLEKANIPCTYIYSSLDQMARTINISKFRARKVKVLLVTDIAARGIDIPLLDNVINYSFPAKAKLFVHRVGRVARAGRSGKAFSLVAPDEMAYLLDLHLFLGKPITWAKLDMQEEDGISGTVPQSVIDGEVDLLQNWHDLSVDLKSMLKVTKNAYQQYFQVRPAASSESIRRMKKIKLSTVSDHPIFKVDDAALERNKMLADMKKFRPNTTIFELGPLARTQANVIMREKRKVHSKYVKKIDDESLENECLKETRNTLPSADENDLKGFAQSVTIKNFEPSNKKKNSNFRDTEHYLSYVPSDHFKEKGLGIQTFEQQAADVVIDLAGDEEEMLQKMKSKLKWNSKKKKFIQENNDKSKKMKTESGVWIPKSYKTDVYKKWKEVNKIRYQQNDNDEEDNQSEFGKQRPMFGYMRRWTKKVGPQEKSSRPPKRELKNAEEILKGRKRLEKLKNLRLRKKRQCKSTHKKNVSQRKKK
ncbi:ATP-dependent RNA helicase DDX54 [Trichonephila inaurata madagascariensis]|uniref:RNA helicase n=1 Tax=Trichonephila inaurata madagascariensis TaxID=2747483 RepID=A0A8X6XCD2_9ARAC|nr:ATP-dependent RNA helicase DDX54 [Trichonephila inaurata madagascariensis]